MTAAAEVAGRLRSEHERVLAPLVRGHERVALIDFPNHSNVGDSAIWLGETDLLRALEIEAVYVCDVAGYDEAQLRSRLGDGLILIHGGGNLGDLWPKHQLFREDVIARFGDNPIVQLPQTIHFREAAAAERAAAVFDAHEGLTVLARDAMSLDAAREHFPGTAVALCPDSAFRVVAPEARAPEVDVVYLARIDQERAHEPPASGAGVDVVDWISDLPYRPEWAQRRNAAAQGEPLRQAYDAQAAALVEHGFRLLQRGRAVVTDRLHAHIFCVLAGLPHVLLDNSYGKLSSFHETWTHDCDLTAWAADPDDALRLARERLAA